MHIVSPDFGDKPEMESFDATAVKERPAKPPSGAENEGKTTQKHTVMVSLYISMKLSAYFILFRDVLWNHQEQSTLSKRGKGWEVLPFALEKIIRIASVY